MWLQGATIETLMDQGRWKSADSVRTYIDAVAMRATNDLLFSSHQRHFIMFAENNFDTIFADLPFKPA